MARLRCWLRHGIIRGETEKEKGGELDCFFLQRGTCPIPSPISSISMIISISLGPEAAMSAGTYPPATRLSDGSLLGQGCVHRLRPRLYQ